jgi:AcrR family transcriptional regulator
MNERSFIKIETMARITDLNRLERLKQSTMKLVVEKGYGGASAALIATDAKVAAGYFYLHYKGKYEMVNSLMHQVFQEIMDMLRTLWAQGSPVDVLIRELIHYLIEMANNEPVKVKFLYVLSNDYSFVLDREMKSNINNFIQTVLDQGKTQQSIDPAITSEDLYLILVINTIQFINQRFKKSEHNAVLFSKADEDHLHYLIQKILK